MLFDLIEERWPASHGRAHSYANGAIAAAPPSFFNLCLHTVIPPHVDLLLLEFGANTDAKTRTHLGGVEGVMRRALRWPGRPAVLLVDWTSHWGWPVENGRAVRITGPMPPRWALRPGLAGRPHHVSAALSDWDYFAISERHAIQRLSSYYQIPHVATHAALWHYDRANHSRFRHEHVAADWNPNALGHRIMAECAFHLLQLAERRLLLLRPQHAAADKEYREEEADDEKVAAVAVPPPTDASVSADMTDGYVCARGDALARMVVASTGFAHVQFDPDDPKRRIKPGLLSTRLGDTVQLEVGRVHTEVIVGHLVSFVDCMGWAKVTCVRGCACTQTVLDGHHRQGNSILTHAPISIDPPGSSHCTIELKHISNHSRRSSSSSSSTGTDDDATPSDNASKFKILSVMVAPLGHSMAAGLAFEEASETVLEQAEGVVVIGRVATGTARV